MSNTFLTEAQSAIQRSSEKAEGAALSAYLRALGEHILEEADKLQAEEEALGDDRPIEVGDTVRILADPHYNSWLSEGDVLEVFEVDKGSLVVGPGRIYVLPEHVERVSE